MGLLTPPAHAARQVNMPLGDFVAQMRTFMPTEGSGTYVAPSVLDRAAFTTVARALVRGDIATAEWALSSYPGFEVLDFRDGDRGPRYLVLAEKPPLSRGWGFYFFAEAPERNALVLEAPHPLADHDSELAAARAVSSLRPAAFLLAGAHRYADVGRISDVAHTSASIFEAVHEVVSTAERVAVQIHGFSAAGHQGYPDLILSSGTVDPSADARVLCDDARGRGLDCNLFTGVDYVPLGATTNVQGGYVRRSFGDGHFLHFETAEIVREDPARFDAIIAALQARWPAARGCSASGSGPGPALELLATTFLLRAGRRRRRDPFPGQGAPR